MLGADRVVATQMVVADGKYTGEIETYAYGPTKAEAVRELAAAEGYDLARSFAYSDSVTDLPMLEAVGHPYAVNPDRALRKVAVERGWPVLDFHRPVSLRSRFSGLRPPGRRWRQRPSVPASRPRPWSGSPPGAVPRSGVSPTETVG